VDSGGFVMERRYNRMTEVKETLALLQREERDQKNTEIRWKTRGKGKEDGGREEAWRKHHPSSPQTTAGGGRKPRKEERILLL
jgi:hypothetical protein